MTASAIRCWTIAEEDHALAAFYQLATGDDKGASSSLAQAGKAATLVEAAFE